MNYSKLGIRTQQRQIAASSGKWGMKLWVLIQGALLLGVIGAVLISMSAGMGLLTGIINTSPDVGMIDVTPSGFSTFVYDTEGNQTAKLVSTDSNRIPVTLDMVPENLQHAFVAIEDARFYDHRGIDIQGIIRAAVVGIRQGLHFSEGASTITQQLLKNNVFTSWTSEGETEARIFGLNLASLRRKIQEQYLAVQLEKSMSKDDILINYLNTINLGQNTLGVQAASLRYFNKPVSALNLSECAVIASITQNPSAFNPITHPEKNAERREKVLNNMKEQGFIDQEAYDRALADDVYSRIQTTNNDAVDETVNSYFVDALTNDILDDLIDAGYNETQAYSLLYSGGLKIYSTQNPKIQGICDEVFQDENNFPANTKWDLDFALTVTKANGERVNHSTEMFRSYFKNQNASFNMLFSSQEAAYDAVREYEEAILEEGDEILKERINLTPEPQVSITVMDQYTGQVAALVGGRGTKEASRTFNRATDAFRQPGSTFKVVAAYAPALDSAGQTLATVYNDAPYCYDGGRQVRNWYKGYRGICSYRQGIESSLNVIAVKTLTAITPQLGYEYLMDLGFTTLTDGVEIGGQIYSDVTQTLALGGVTYGVKNIELTAAYATIANGGEYIKPKLYTRVVDHEGNVILDNSPLNSHRVLKETTAWLLTSAMKDVVTGAGGTGGRVNFGTTAIAGKTGTTTANNDVWFVGYTDYYTAACWAGYDSNNAKLTASDESNLAKNLWRKVMERIHEGLEYRDFAQPEGIVTATVCSRSGRRPIAGLCDGHLKTEYFAEGTVPTESCCVHYQGTICRYDRLPAADQCPFKIEGVSELPLPEPAALARGTSLAGGAVNSTSTDENGNAVSVARHCRHDAAFFAQENAEALIAQQQAELDAAQAAVDAAQAAAAAAAAAEAAPPPEPEPEGGEE